MASEYQPLMDYVNNLDDYNFCNGIKVVSIGNNTAECRVDLFPGSFNPQGFVHGGLLFAICDVATGYAVSGDERRCVTASSSFSYLHEVMAGQKFIRAVGKAIEIEQKTAVVEGCVYDENGRLVAKGIYNYFFPDA